MNECVFTGIGSLKKATLKQEVPRRWGWGGGLVVGWGGSGGGGGAC